MNWKNVLRLISVEIKAGRLIRGQRLRRYRESRILQYLLYGGACVLGLAIGVGVGSFYTVVPDPCLLYTSPSPRDRTRSRMPSSA